MRVIPLGLAVAAMSLPAVAATTVPPSDAAIEAQCRPYFHDACSEAMARWLPDHFDESWTWSRHATVIENADEFEYGRGRRPAGSFADSPFDGTLVVYGMAGPPKAVVVYDPMHRIAFYGQGCCSWYEGIEATGVSPPPKPVVQRDLSRLATRRGAKVGQTPAQIRRIYGEARMQAVDGHPGLGILAYRMPLRAPGQPASSKSTCDRYQNFFFRAGRVIAIQLGSAC